MKIAKLVIGVLSILLGIFIFFQSCTTGIYNTMIGIGGIEATAGLVTAILMMAAGIVGITTRNLDNQLWALAIVIIYCLASLFSILLADRYVDLIIWGTLCLVFAIFYVDSMIKDN